MQYGIDLEDQPPASGTDREEVNNIREGKPAVLVDGEASRNPIERGLSYIPPWVAVATVAGSHLRVHEAMAPPTSA